MERLKDKPTPLILEIKGNALDDGPGIRSVVFFKGCPLNCLWCHNPESKSTLQEITFDSQKCVGCDACLSSCTRQALNRDNPFFIDRKRCNLCFECVQTCPAEALRPTGRSIQIESIVEHVCRDKPFFDASGGGVTLSGGEPTLYMDFAAKLLEAFKQEQIHTLVETCGMFDLNRFLKEIFPLTDMIYFDIKLMDASDHWHYCGRHNIRIIENFRQIYRRSHANGIDVIPRMPLVPGITDTQKNLTATAAFLNDCGADTIELLPYHPIWQEKNRMIGVRDTPTDDTELGSFLSPDRLDAARKVFRDAGIQA